MLDNQQNTDLSLEPIKPRSLIEEVVERIEHAIDKRVFKPGQKLLSEPKLAQQLGVSRNTLREALNILIQKEVLYRNRGVGTFVSEKLPVNMETALEQVVSTTEIIKKQGYAPGVSDFSTEVLPASAMLAEKLQIAEFDPVMMISRTRTANGIPVIRSYEHLPLPVVEAYQDQLELASHMENWSLYGFLKGIGYDLYYVLSVVRALKTNANLARYLSFKTGEPVLCFEQTHFARQMEKPVLYCLNYHNDKLIDAVFIRRS